MRIAFVHYHLQPGGVTRIIENTFKALKSYDVSTVVLSGKEPEDWWKEEYRVIPGLQYEMDRPQISEAELASEMEKEATEALGGSPDIWHIYNHSLGKNMIFPGALYLLASKGHHILFHIHDFAEDGRPHNYYMMLEKIACGKHLDMFRKLYPVGCHVHYGVINGRDHNYLTMAGIDKSCLHRLPNPVRIASNIVLEQKESAGDVPLWLYSTRAIRRKNIGEFLLWAAIAPENRVYATSLGPQNPKEKPRYEAWKRLAGELSLPVEFDLSKKAGMSFIKMLKQAHGMVTTSIGEGFGLAFLEPWLVNRPVCGRDLPEVTTEFREEGIRLSNLYSRLSIPVHWLGVGRAVNKAWAGYVRSLESYGRMPAEGSYDRLVRTWIQDEMVDFGRLDEELQELVLRRIVQHPDEASALIPQELPCLFNNQEDLLHNKEILLKRYSLEGYGCRLIKTYKRVLACPASKLDYLNGNILLDLFLQPERLNLLKVD
jgi:glycosyltransferase involved in cell wall biosynthesis